PTDVLVSGAADAVVTASGGVTADRQVSASPAADVSMSAQAVAPKVAREAVLPDGLAADTVRAVAVPSAAVVVPPSADNGMSAEAPPPADALVSGPTAADPGTPMLASADATLTAGGPSADTSMSAEAAPAAGVVVA